MKLSHLVLLLPLLVLSWSGPADAEIGTAFSLQGRLANDAGPTSGPVDLRITPWDDATAGASLEAPVVLGSVALEEGVFSVDVDFGPLPFLGQPVWLAVEVRGPGEADYTLLEPRQRLAPTPYALHARSVAVDSIDGFAIQDGAVGADHIAPGAVGAAAVDPAAVQRRIGPDCAAGQALAGVAEDGSSSCVPTGDEDWFIWPDGSAVTANKKVSVGTDGIRNAQLLVTSNSGVLSPQLELVETENDYARLSLANSGAPGAGHFGFWTLAARTYSADDGGPATDRINFYNSRTGDPMVLLGDGRLGIGVFNPTEALDVDGVARIRGMTAGDGVAGNRRLLVDNSGRLAAAPRFRYLTMSGYAFTSSLAAPVSLEGPVRIVSVTAFLKDSSTTKDLHVILLRTIPSDNSEVVDLVLNTTGSADPGIYREFSGSYTGPIYSGTEPLTLAVLPMLAGTSTVASWDSNLGVSAIRLQLREP